MKNTITIAVATLLVAGLTGVSVHKYDKYTVEQQKAAQVAALEREHQFELVAAKAKLQVEYQACKLRLAAHNNLSPSLKAKDPTPVCTEPK